MKSSTTSVVRPAVYDQSRMLTAEEVKEISGGKIHVSKVSGTWKIGAVQTESSKAVHPMGADIDAEGGGNF